jgi:hypothetical protein
MTLHLTNSNPPPLPGYYHWIRINAPQVRDTVDAIRSRFGCQVRSSIGHFQTADILAYLLGRDVPTGEKAESFQDGDVALVMRIRRRRSGLITKGGPLQSGDFEYYLVAYGETMESLARLVEQLDLL